MRRGRKIDEKFFTREVTLLLLFGVSTSLGFVYARVGHVSAVACHFVYDVIVLHAYQRLQKTPALVDKP